MNYTEYWRKFKTEAWYRWTTFLDTDDRVTHWVETNKEGTNSSFCTARVRPADSLVIRSTLYCRECEKSRGDELRARGWIARYDGVYLDGFDVYGGKWSPNQQMCYKPVAPGDERYID